MWTVSTPSVCIIHWKNVKNKVYTIHAWDSEVLDIKNQRVQLSPILTQSPEKQPMAKWPKQSLQAEYQEDFSKHKV
jgi:hypothetical protein